MKRQVNARVSEATREKLIALTAVYGTQAEVLAVAIDRLYTSTVSPSPIYACTCGRGAEVAPQDHAESCEVYQPF